MKWEDPPAKKLTRYTSKKNAYEDEAEELRARPGAWAVLVEFPLPADRKGKDHNQGRAVAHNIRSGKYVKFRPAGSFEAISNIAINDAGKEVVRVHARYTGGNVSEVHENQ